MRLPNWLRIGISLHPASSLLHNLLKPSLLGALMDVTNGVAIRRPPMLTGLAEAAADAFTIRKLAFGCDGTSALCSPHTKTMERALDRLATLRSVGFESTVEANIPKVSPTATENSS